MEELIVDAFVKTKYSCCHIKSLIQVRRNVQQEFGEQHLQYEFYPLINSNFMCYNWEL